jgi:general secretion pathway protein D
VALYREAVARDPKQLEARIALERAMRMASAEHGKRAQALEAQDQLPGAIAEYKLAADFDPTSSYYLTKAQQLERTLRERVEAGREPPRIDQLRQQARQTSPFPQLDPRTPVPVMSFPNAAARDILSSIGKITGISISYDRGAENQLTTAYTIDLQGEPLEAVLQQILTAHNMAFKVTGPQSIFIYADTAQNRQKYDDLYEQTFYIEHGDVSELVTLITQFTQGGTGVRPVIQPLKSANAISIKATAQVLQVAEAIIRANDKPRAEVMIEVEILEVDRNRMLNLGIDLSNWALGFTYSPEFPPPNTSGGIPPVPPPPINLNTLRGGASRQDFYMTVPTAAINLMQSDSRTKVLAKPTLRGREGVPIQLNLGDEIPVPRTTFQSATPGQVGTTPTTSFDLRQVGVNLSMTPRVTYDGEIILQDLLVEKSAVGPFVDIAGQSLPTFTSRRATTALRLRDGESSMLAGLLEDEQITTNRGLPGITSLPILRNIFGFTNRTGSQTDVVMVITPRIVRSHEFAPEDFRPRYVGTAQNPGAGTVPTLISPGAPPPPPLAPPGTGQAVTPGAAATPTLPGATPPPSGVTPPRAPGVVAITPVGGEGQPPATAGRATLVPAGTEHPAGNVFAAPIQVANLSGVGTITVTVSYDPAVLRATAVTQGTFMNAGGVTTTFAPKIDAAAGRVDFAISRPTDRPGAATVDAALLAAVNFQAVAAGSATVSMTIVATTPAGQPVTVQTSPVTITVK